jgi:uncharacterized protein YidB (DUF937 family)
MSEKERQMASKMPSLKVLLGLLAIAGYQNREKIGEFLKNATGPGGALDEARKKFADGETGTSVRKGLEDLVKKFEDKGEGDKPKSWIETGPNKPVTEAQVEKSVGPDFIDELAAKSGLSRDDLLKRLREILPEGVDKLTPEGKIPV